MFYDLAPSTLRGRGLRRLTRDDLRGPYAPWRRSGNSDTASKDGIQLLRRLGLAMYSDMMGYHRVGFTNARHQHEHDRWVYRTHGPTMDRFGRREDHGWLYLHEAHTRKQDTIGQDAATLVEDLFYLESSVRRGQAQGLSSTESLRQLRLLGGQNFELLLRSAALKPGINYTQAHDLLYHWETWLPRHREAAGMPRELVLRMHGLGPVLDAGIELNGYAQ